MTLAPAPDLFSPEFMQDPYPTFAWLRCEDPVHWSPAYEQFVITRFEDCITVLMHPEQFGSPNTHPSRSVADHVVYRNLIARAFDADFVAAQEPFIRDTVNECIEQFEDESKIDLMPALAQPLPTRLLGHILGIPETEYEMFGVWAQAYTDSMSGTLGEQETQQYRQIVQDL